jgi:glucose-1-phosphate thymidylyltransferase
MTVSSRPLLGIVPAGGLGSRLAPFRYPKELLPVIYEKEFHGGSVRPRAVIECAIEALRLARVPRCAVVVAPWKLDVVRYLGDGEEHGVQIMYLYQELARGLPLALDTAYAWTHDTDVVFVMPDTVLRPENFALRLVETFRSTDADVTLAIFPTDEPERLGPVVHDDGLVRAVYDKQPNPPAANTWGAAVWGPRFRQLLRDVAAREKDGPTELSFGACLSSAINAGLRVTAVAFPDGSFLDVGTASGLAALLHSRQVQR